MRPAQLTCRSKAISVTPRAAVSKAATDADPKSVRPYLSLLIASAARPRPRGWPKAAIGKTMAPKDAGLGGICGLRSTMCVNLGAALKRLSTAGAGGGGDLCRRACRTPRASYRRQRRDSEAQKDLDYYLAEHVRVEPTRSAYCAPSLRGIGDGRPFSWPHRSDSSGR